VLAEIAEVAGLEAALAIAGECGGTQVYIPRRAADDHWLVEACGRTAADAICRHYAGTGGMRLRVPLGPTGSIAQIRARADRMIREGRSTTEVARAVGYTTRGVEKRKARARARGDGQDDLFS
jgi:hypothetical protein